MAKGSITTRDRDALAAADDIQRILGTLDEAKLLDIMALRPTILDIEEASVWLAGDADVFGAGPAAQTGGWRRRCNSDRRRRGGAAGAVS